VDTVRKVLIVGGGVSGLALAICLRRLNLEVDLVERDAEWRALGAGLSFNGASLKAFKRVDTTVFERLLAEGQTHSGVALYTPSGMLIAKLSPPDDGSGVPSGGGVLRPVLHQILVDATRKSGARVRLGVTVTALIPQNGGAQVRCSDGVEDHYDLVVGADGLHSQVRNIVFPEAGKPRFTGQGCWRAVFPRPADLDRVSIYQDAYLKAGLNPVSRELMYLFLLESVPSNRRMPENEWPQLLAERLAPFGGPIAALAAQLGPGSNINYRPLETILLPSPWYRGNVVLIGDAAHATTPHSAYGCGLAVEDAVVLAESLEKHPTLPAALDAFMQRRFRRCKAVVDGSVKLGDLEMAHVPPAEHQVVSAEVAKVIAEPI
jgi:2-polyprenyl-6-methoxyphenol hydroxylase-like FAD-dependent oxidoreductase